MCFRLVCWKGKNNCKFIFVQVDDNFKVFDVLYQLFCDDDKGVVVSWMVMVVVDFFEFIKIQNSDVIR